MVLNWDKVPLGLIPDGKLALLLGETERVVRSQRRKRGLGVYKSGRGYTPDDWDKLFTLFSPETVANAIWQPMYVVRVAYNNHLIRLGPQTPAHREQAAADTEQLIRRLRDFVGQLSRTLDDTNEPGVKLGLAKRLIEGMHFWLDMDPAAR